MAKKKTKTRKRRVRGIPALPHHNLPPLKIRDDRVRALLTRLIKTGRDLNSQDKQVLADHIATLKD